MGVTNVAELYLGRMPKSKWLQKYPGLISFLDEKKKKKETRMQRKKTQDSGRIGTQRRGRGIQNRI